ncbi:MAG TPA: Uma2 family endonuclease, partial [Patescibacteria group bacterium]
MTTTPTQPKQLLTFEQFITQLPGEERYELIEGEIVKILATRQHEDVADFIGDTFKAEVKRLSLNYRVSDRIVIRTLTQNGREQGRHPDVSVVVQGVTKKLESLLDEGYSSQTLLIK